MHACSLNLPLGAMMADEKTSAAIRADFERSFRTLRSLPVDIWITSHARDFARWRKFSERGRAADSVAPFIDREGYYRYIDAAEGRIRKELASPRQQAKP